MSKSTFVALAAAARTASTAGPVLEWKSARALRLYLTVTAAGGSGGLQVVVRGYATLDGAAVELSAGGPPVGSTGVFVYEMQPWPGPEATGAVLEVTNRAVPVQWDVYVKHGDTASYTYSVVAEAHD